MVYQGIGSCNPLIFRFCRFLLICLLRWTRQRYYRHLTQSLARVRRSGMPPGIGFTAETIIHVTIIVLRYCLCFLSSLLCRAFVFLFHSLFPFPLAVLMPASFWACSCCVARAVEYIFPSGTCAFPLLIPGFLSLTLSLRV